MAMQAAKKGVTFEEDIVPGADASYSEKISFYMKKAPVINKLINNPTQRFLVYNVGVMGATVFAIIQWGEVLAI
jgi:hypothetical protein